MPTPARLLALALAGACGTLSLVIAGPAVATPSSASTVSVRIAATASSSRPAARPWVSWRRLAQTPKPAVVANPLPWAPQPDVFGSASFWRAPITGAPVASTSGPMVAALAASVNAGQYKTAAFNVSGYTTTFYATGASIPRTNVAWDNCQHLGPQPGIAAQLAGIPIPAGAVPSPGSDAEMTLYSPATDQLWELWEAKHTASGWSACWGGRIDHVSTSRGYFLGGYGATATGLPVAGGMISIQDVRAGRISHAVGLEVPMTASGAVSWPAQRGDGHATGANAIPEGTRLRLDPSLNLSTLGLNPIGLMVARAAQTYGFVVTDSGPVAVQAESGIPMQQRTGTDPWTAPLATGSGFTLKNFPWSHLQALPANYGR